MAFWDSFVDVLLSTLTALWSLFVLWFGVFIAPFKNFDVLWIVIPIWLAWFFADYFQEKQATSFGNAVSNGIIPIWVAIDWSRFLVGQLMANPFAFTWTLLAKFLIILFIFAYGTLVVYYAFKAKPLVRYLGRIREVTYLLLVFTPVIYDLVTLSWLLISAIILYFPLWYFGLALFFKLMPNPKTLRRDEPKKLF